jgi:hypothetical protein
MSILRPLVLSMLASAASSPSTSLAETFPTAGSQAMEFRLALTGDCPDCRFVAAEGPIVVSTPDDFMAFVSALPDNNAAGLTVHFNSAGGDPAAAIRLGDLIRLQGMNTTVGRTVGDVDVGVQVKLASAERETGEKAVSDASAGLCAGACILAFAGGVQRMAATSTPPDSLHGQQLGSLLVHQIPLADDGTGPGGAEDAARAITLRDLLDYLTRMGVSAELVQMFLIVPDRSPVQIEDLQLQRLSLDNRMPARAELVGYRNGVAVLEIELDRPTGHHSLELYCEKGHAKILATIHWSAPIDKAFADDLGLFEAMALSDGKSVKLESAEYSTEGGQTTARLRLTIEGLKPAGLPQMKAFEFSDPSGLDAGRVARDLSFELPTHFGGLGILSRHCL